MKMLDLFNDYNRIIANKPVKKIGKIQRIKINMNYNKSESKEKCCKTCNKHVKIDYHNKTYHKCRLIGNSSSTATDIKMSNVCNKWECNI